MDVDRTPHSPDEATRPSRATALDEDGNVVGMTATGRRVDKLKEKLAHIVDEHEGKDGAFAGYINQTKGCIGAGILGLPLAFAMAGWVYGLMLVAAIAIINAYGLFLLASCAEKIGGHRTSWGGLARSTYPWTAPLVDFLIIFNNSGAAVGYLIVFSDTLASVSVNVFGAPATGLLGQRAFWGSAVFWGIVAPLASLRDYSKLKFSSTIGVIAVMYLTGLTFAYAIVPTVEPCPDVVGPPNCGGEVIPFMNNGISIFTSIPIITLAFLTSDSSFLVYNDLRDNSMSRMTRFVNTPMVITASAVFTITALSAYLTFGDNISGNFVLNYPVTDLPVAAAYLAIAIISTASSPIKIHPSRASLLSLLYFTLSKVTGDNPLTWWDGAFPAVMLYAMTFLNLVVVYALGMILTDLGLVYSVVGAVAATGLMFYLPGFFFYKLFEADETALIESEKLRRVMGDAEKGSSSKAPPTPKMMFSPFWLRFNRDAGLVLGFAGIALSVICVAALAVEYALFNEGSTEAAPATESIGLSSMSAMIEKWLR